MRTCTCKARHRLPPCSDADLDSLAFLAVHAAEVALADVEHVLERQQVAQDIAATPGPILRVAQKLQEGLGIGSNAAKSVCRLSPLRRLRAGLGGPLCRGLHGAEEGLAVPREGEAVVVPVEGTRAVHQVPRPPPVGRLLPLQASGATLDDEDRVRGHNEQQGRLRLVRARAEEVGDRTCGTLGVVEEVVHGHAAAGGDAVPDLLEGVID
mmetsp:Transcript_7422/g.23309  ORF Transcript_7422/g.23309 Transcript_7422/m.23309 type:complete len:210 (+) Transcript_7422:11-640(+)